MWRNPSNGLIPVVLAAFSPDLQRELNCAAQHDRTWPRHGKKRTSYRNGRESAVNNRFLKTTVYGEVGAEIQSMAFEETLAQASSNAGRYPCVCGLNDSTPINTN
jgi:hypothetical protein